MRELSPKTLSAAEIIAQTEGVDPQKLLAFLQQEVANVRKEAAPLLGEPKSDTPEDETQETPEQIAAILALRGKPTEKEILDALHAAMPNLGVQLVDVLSMPKKSLIVEVARLTKKELLTLGAKSGDADRQRIIATAVTSLLGKPTITVSDERAWILPQLNQITAFLTEKNIEPDYGISKIARRCVKSMKESQWLYSETDLLTFARTAINGEPDKTEWEDSFEIIPQTLYPLLADLQLNTSVLTKEDYADLLRVFISYLNNFLDTKLGAIKHWPMTRKAMSENLRRCLDRDKRVKWIAEKIKIRPIIAQWKGADFVPQDAMEETLQRVDTGRKISALDREGFLLDVRALLRKQGFSEGKIVEPTDLESAIISLVNDPKQVLEIRAGRLLKADGESTLAQRTKKYLTNGG